MDQSPENLSERVSIRLPPSTGRQLDKIAQEDKREKSEVIRLAIEEYVKGWELARVLEPARRALMESVR